MKRTELILMTVLLIMGALVVNQEADAHGGGTNAEGCHTEKRTEHYHCHNSGTSVETYRPDTNHSSKYDRKSWPHWIDADGDCQDTRAEILIRDSVVPVKFKRNKGCNVSWGQWIGPYTGKTITQASDLDIDHIVPLSHAHETGGANWTRDKKRQFANDPDNLLAVDDATNQKKGDKGPARWKPPSKSYWCEYSRRWRQIKSKYGLTISTPEERSLIVMGRTCN